MRSLWMKACCKLNWAQSFQLFMGMRMLEPWPMAIIMAHSLAHLIKASKAYIYTINNRNWSNGAGSSSSSDNNRFSDNNYFDNQHKATTINYTKVMCVMHTKQIQQTLLINLVIKFICWLPSREWHTVCECVCVSSWRSQQVEQIW